MMGKTILIVEDEGVWRKLLARLFGGCGYNVVLAESCQAAFKALRSSRVDCAILDFDLGDGNGEEVCMAIREKDGGRKTPVILFTGDHRAAEYMFGPYRADMLVFKDRPLLALPGLMDSLFKE